jgi:hypothetical protein
MFSKINNIKHFLMMVVISMIFTHCQQGNESKISYPREIVEHNMQDQYDLAKWVLYKRNFKCTLPDSIYNPHNLTFIRIDFNNLIECDLLLDTLWSTNDTTFFMFHFMKNEFNISYLFPDCTNYHTVGIYKNKVVYLGIDDGLFIVNPINNSRLENEFVIYLKTNKELISKWLLQMVEEKGIIR